MKTEHLQNGPLVQMTRIPKRTSMAMVGKTGVVAPSWQLDAELTALANQCFRACLNPTAKPDLIKVYRNNASSCFGRCFVDQRIITITKNKGTLHVLETLAHELAHLRIIAHGPKHDELTAKLYEWIKEVA